MPIVAGAFPYLAVASCPDEPARLKLQGESGAFVRSVKSSSLGNEYDLPAHSGRPWELI